MLYIILFAFIIFIILVVIIFLRILHIKRVNQTICCLEGKFSVYGTKNKFVIKKDNRFTFIVDNGRIISVKDKNASSKQVEYGGH